MSLIDIIRADVVKVGVSLDYVYRLGWFDLIYYIERKKLEDGRYSKFEGRFTFWVKDGELHRENGPAIERASGEKYWYLNGELHREDGPAIEWANGKEWFLNGYRHRENGPAIELTDGNKEWYLNGNFIRSEP